MSLIHFVLFFSLFISSQSDPKTFLIELEDEEDTAPAANEESPNVDGEENGNEWKSGLDYRSSKKGRK